MVGVHSTYLHSRDYPSEAVASRFGAYQSATELADFLSLHLTNGFSTTLIEFRVTETRGTQVLNTVARVALAALTPLVVAACIASAQSGDAADSPVTQRAPFVPSAFIEENRLFANPESATQIRAELSRFVFGVPFEQLRTAPARETRLDAHPLAPAGLVASIAQLDLPLRDEWFSRALLMVPRQRSKGVVIFHEGHLQGGRWEESETANDLKVISDLLGRGHVVVFMSMPLTWENPRQVIQHPRYGRISIEIHDQFRLLENDLGFNPLRLFLEPVKAALQEVRERFPGEETCLLGLSGGGWTVEMYAALDPTVRCTISVAGSLPLSMRTMPSVQLSWGDYEQTHPGVLSRMTYHEAYLLAALEPGRTFTKYLIKDDPCCYAVQGDPTFDDDIARFFAETGGGHMEVVIDDTVVHHSVGALPISRASESLLSSRR